MRIFLFCILLSFNIFAQNLSQSFPAGKGANYKVKVKGDSTPILLSMYIAGTRVDSVHIEYFMETKGLFPVQMWQQFEIGVDGKGTAKIRKGFVFTKSTPKPEIMTDAYLAGAAGGIQVNDFLFSNKAELEKYKIGQEIVEISAGTTKATHYRRTNNGQTVDFWISDDAKPMGLVMLTSKSDINPNQNYSLEMVNLIENVKAKIQPEKAVPLTKEGASMLAKPSSLR